MGLEVSHQWLQHLLTRMQLLFIGSRFQFDLSEEHVWWVLWLFPCSSERWSWCDSDTPFNRRNLYIWAQCFMSDLTHSTLPTHLIFCLQRIWSTSEILLWSRRTWVRSAYTLACTTGYESHKNPPLTEITTKLWHMMSGIYLWVD